MRASKVVVITGASSGFGRGIAAKLARQGDSVVLAARRAEVLAEVARECNARARHGARAIAVPTDVADPSQVERLAAAAEAEFGQIDAWINNAGVAAVGWFNDIPLEDHLQVVQTNLLGVISGSYYAMRHFRARDSGILVNVSSVLGKVPAPYYASYAASKYGVVGLGATLRQELRLARVANIHVCTVLPISADTPFFEHAAGYTGRKIEPIPPVANPARVVRAVVNLLTDPKDEVVVGGSGKVAVLAHHLVPRLTERLMARNAENSQRRNPEAFRPDGSGNLHEPVPTGTDMRRSRETD